MQESRRYIGSYEEGTAKMGKTHPYTERQIRSLPREYRVEVAKPILVRVSKQPVNNLYAAWAPDLGTLMRGLTPEEAVIHLREVICLDWKRFQSEEVTDKYGKKLQRALRAHLQQDHHNLESVVQE